MRTFEEQERGWCRHFRGALKQTCEAGHVMAELDRPLPCIDSSRNWGQCPDHAVRTDEEIAERKRQSDAALTRYLTLLSGGQCPECEAAVTKRVQVGRCVYAEPCGHRLYQGKA